MLRTTSISTSPRQLACENCGRAAATKAGLCGACYQYQYRTGQARPVAGPWQAHCTNCGDDSDGHQFCVVCDWMRQSNAPQFDRRRASLICECGRPAQPVSVLAWGALNEPYLLTIPVCEQCRAELGATL
jgi:hypothetical protein